MNKVEKRIAEIIRRAKYEGYLSSRKWKRKKNKKLADADYKCQRCNYGEYDFQDMPLDIHHITYERFGNEQMSDLEVLCRSCHEKQHGRQFTKRKYTNDIDLAEPF